MSERSVEQKEVEQLGALLGNHPSLCHVIGDSLVTTIQLERKEMIIPSKEMQWILLHMSFGQKAKFIEPYDEIKDQGPMLSQEVFCNVSLGLLNRNCRST